MNKIKRLEKALALITPVAASVRERRPAGFSHAQADSAALYLDKARTDLTDALSVFRLVERTKEGRP